MEEVSEGVEEEEVVVSEEGMLRQLSHKLAELHREKAELQTMMADLEKSLEENVKKQEQAREELSRLLAEEKEISKKKVDACTRLDEVNKRIEKLSTVKKELEELWRPE